MVLWRLTEKGKDTLPILLMLTAFSSKWYSEFIFEDKKPRKLNEIFSQPEAREIIMSYIMEQITNDLILFYVYPTFVDIPSGPYQ